MIRKMKSINKRKAMLKFFRVVLLSMLAFVANQLKAQDATFSQFFNNPIYYNPALAGSNLGLRTRLNYRSQWNGMENSYDNYSFCMDVAERNLPGAGGLGLIVVSDFEGLGNIRSTSITTDYAVRVRLGKKFISQFGLSAAYVHRTIDWNNFVFSDQLHPAYGITGSSGFQPPDYNSIWHPDFGSGVSLKYIDYSSNFEELIIGLHASVLHLLQPDISFTGNGIRQPRKLVIMGDGIFELSRYQKHYFPIDKFNINFIVENQGIHNNFAVGINACKNILYAGCWFRSQRLVFKNVKDLILMAGVNFRVSDESSMKFMYSYDYTLSNFRRSFGATHEVSLILEFEEFSIFRKKGFWGTNRALSGTDDARSSLECSSF